MNSYKTNIVDNQNITFTKTPDNIIIKKSWSIGTDLSGIHTEIYDTYYDLNVLSFNELFKLKKNIDTLILKSI